MSLTLAEDHKINSEQKSVGFIYMHTSQLLRIKLNMVLQQLKFNIVVILSCEIYVIEENNFYSIDWVKEKLMLACIPTL